MTTPSDVPSSRLTVTQWLIVAMAAIGFAFDIYELLVLPLIIRPAMVELTGFTPGSPGFLKAVEFWKPLLFFLPAMVGGVFGLLGGYLTDRLGRRRVLTWSIVIYSLSAFLAGFSTSLWMLLVLRCTTFIGVCVEFVAAISWLAELFPERQQRERVLGYTQAFSSVGGILVAVANAFLLDDRVRQALPPIAIPSFLSSLGSIDAAHQREAWRYTLMSGLIPALPLLLIRPFMPESPAWQRKKNEGTLRRPSIAELFSPQLARTTIVTTIMVACSYGVAFGAIQQMQDIVPGLADVQKHAEGKPRPVRLEIEQKTYNNYNKVQEIGGLVGRFALAFLAVRIIGRRRLLWVFLAPSLIVVPLVFYFFLTIPNHEFFTIDLSMFRLGALPITTVSLGVFFAGFLTVAQFSFWGNYLPRVYPLHLRGTGESVAANIGGRMIGTSFAALTNLLAVQPFIPGGSQPAKFAFTAGSVALAAIAVNLIASCFLPEPDPKLDV